MTDRDAWGDWRTDTAARPALDTALDAALDPGSGAALGRPPATDETRALPPVPAVPLEPSADLPRAPRFPLYADGPSTHRPGTDVAAPGPVRRRRPFVPWVAAATVVALAAGTAGTIAAGRPDAVVTSGVGETTGLDRLPTEDLGGPGPARGPEDTGGPADARSTDSPDSTDRGSRRPGSSRGGDVRPSAEPTPRVSRRDARPVAARAAIDAPRTAPPNVDLSGERVTYEATNLVDGRPETAWRVAGDARDTVLTVRLDRPTVITTVGLLNGYAKTGGAGARAVDWYAANRRVRRVEWFFDDGTRVVQSLREDREVQRTDIRPTETSTVRVRIAAVSAPGGGRDGRDYTALSEIALEGVPVGGGAGDGDERRTSD